MMAQPAALSSQKKQRLEASETTAATSSPSQKGLDLEMTMKQYLNSFSPQNEAIEIDRLEMVSCTESRTPLALMLVQNQTDTQVTTLSESTDFQNQVIMYENFSDHSLFSDQELLGNVQVHLPSLASGG